MTHRAFHKGFEIGAFRALFVCLYSKRCSFSAISRNAMSEVLSDAAYEVGRCLVPVRVGITYI